MSQQKKIVLAVAATVALASTATQAEQMGPGGFRPGIPLYFPSPQPYYYPTLFDEDETTTTQKLNALRPVNPRSSRPTTFDEEEAQKFKLSKLVGGISKGLDLWKKGQQVGLLEEDESWGPIRPLRPQLTPFEEEQLQKIKWDRVAQAIGTGLDLWKKGQQVGLFEEDQELQKIKWDKVAQAIGTGLDLWKKGQEVGLFEEDEELQKIKWDKIVRGISTGLDLWRKGQQVGLLEEEEELQKIKWGKIAHAISTGLDLWKKGQQVGLLEEEQDGPTRPRRKFTKEQLIKMHANRRREPLPVMPYGILEEDEASWEVGVGVNGNGRGRPNWNVGIKVGGKFEEEEEEEVQKLRVDLHKATELLVNANKMGLLDEDAELDEAQKLKLGGIVKGAVKVVKVAGAVGLLEEDEQLQRHDVLDALDKALDLYGKAKQVGLFDEEELQKVKWEITGGVSGSGRGRPSWQVGGRIGGTFEQEEELQSQQRPRKPLLQRKLTKD